MDVFRLEVPELKFPAVYAPSTSPFGDGKPLFRISATFTDLPADLQREIRLRWPVRVRELLPLNAYRRVRVYEADERYADLADVLRTADAANVARDALLLDVPASVEVEWIEVLNGGAMTLPPRFEKLVPLSITISIDDLKLPS